MNPFSTITITVSGPGGNISYEVELLKQYLESEGYKVAVENEHPFIAGDPTCSEFSSWEEYHAHRRKLKKGRIKWCKIIARHIPWGG